VTTARDKNTREIVWWLRYFAVVGTLAGAATIAQALIEHG